MAGGHPDAAVGERALSATDLTVVHGLAVTTELRTAWDLGRFSRRDDAIGGLDRLLRTGAFTRDELLGGVERFARQRGVVQLRDLAPDQRERVSASEISLEKGARFSAPGGSMRGARGPPLE